MIRSLLLVAALALPAAAQTGEDHLSLNGTWDFKTETADSRWGTMPVPGNWDTTNTYAHYSGPATYRRDFTPPATWKGSPVRLRFDSVYQQADVQLNGQFLGSHTGGYTPFEFDVTNGLRYGRPNTLTVRVNNKYRRGAWWPWGGISRDVELIRNNAIRITGQTINAEPDLTNGTAKVSLRLTVRNEANSATLVRLNTGLSLANDPKNGWPIFNTVVTLPAHAEKTLAVSTTLPANRVRLWDFDHPNLYAAQTTATIQGAVQHLRRDRFGIREIKVTKDQLLLNGEPVRLAGFNRVHDHRAWGNTEPEHLIRQDVDLMKRLGGNLMRIMHGAQSPALLDYLDEKGILVFEEIPVWGGDDPMQREPGNPTTKRWLREMIERDSNHPCIIGWSVGNELTGHFNYVKSMTDYVRQDLDPRRLAGYVSYSGAWKGSNSSNDPITFSDLAMHNCYSSLTNTATTLRERWPDKPVFFTEFGSSQIGASLDAKLSGLEKNLDAIRKGHPYVAGVSLWTFSDYRSPYKSSALSEDRTWGVVDSWRRPKRAFNQLAAQFSPIASLDLDSGTTIRLQPRAAVDFPSYTLRGYRLQWELRQKNGRIADGAVLNLPTIKPGDAVLTFPIQWETTVNSRITENPGDSPNSRRAWGVGTRPAVSTRLRQAGAERGAMRGSEYEETWPPKNDLWHNFPAQASQAGVNQISLYSEPRTAPRSAPAWRSRVDTAGRVPTLRAFLLLNNTPTHPVDLILTLLTPTGYVAHETRVALDVPAPPRITAIEPGQKSVRVHFTPVPGAEEYKVLYTVPGQTTPAETRATIDTQATVSNLTPGTAYQFSVLALNAKGSSPASASMEASPNGQALPPLLYKAVPTDAACTIGYAVEAGDQSFDIEYGTQFDKLSDSLSNLTVKGAAQITGLRNGTTYYARLRRHGDTGTSNWSTPMPVTPNGHQPPPLPAIQGAVRGPGLISLRFTPTEQAIRYHIRYTTGSQTVTVPLEAAAVTQAVLSGLNDSRAYTLSIAAEGAGGTSAFSAPLTVPKR